MFFLMSFPGQFALPVDCYFFEWLGIATPRKTVRKYLYPHQHFPKVWIGFWVAFFDAKKSPWRLDIVASIGPFCPWKGVEERVAFRWHYLEEHSWWSGVRFLGICKHSRICGRGLWKPLLHPSDMFIDCHAFHFSKINLGGLLYYLVSDNRHCMGMWQNEVRSSACFRSELWKRCCRTRWVEMARWLQRSWKPTLTSTWS